MVKVFPFKGLRPKPDRAKDIASPPYDVLNSQEARDIIQKKPNSFLRVNKPECDFDDSIDPHSQIIYEKAKINLNSFIKKGLMIQDTTPCFYVYRLSIGNTSQTGLCCVMSIEDYDDGLIKKHEHTRPDKVKDRTKHIEILEAQVGPVFSIFRNRTNVTKLFKNLTIEKPETSFTTEDDVTHQFWVIDNSNLIREIQSQFKTIDHCYIADGHHRSESAAEVFRQINTKGKESSYPNAYQYFLQVLFPHDEVNILPYNRVAKIPNDLSLKQLLHNAESKFKISLNTNGYFSPDSPHVFGVYAGGNWYRMELLKQTWSSNDPVGEIDAEILQKNFIDPLLGIQDPKTDDRIQFVGGIRGHKALEKQVDSGDFDIAFSIFATTIDQLMNVADLQKVMPPKSTWFEPKLRSGMVVHLLGGR
jgi:uncharacterized protein (DUF1015 family)